MQFTTFVPLAALLSLQVSSVLAAPVAEPEASEASVGLEKRAGTGTQTDPYILNIDCANFQEVCEAQCIAILCFSSPQVMQYGGAGSSTAQRTLSGAKADPFRSNAQLVGGGTLATPNAGWVSPEDTTNACSVESGVGTLIAPVNAAHNSAEGSKVSGQLSTNKVAAGKYFKKAYTNTGTYCTALMNHQAASSVCSATASASDPINFMYRRTSKKSGNSILWQKVNYPTDKWSKNFPGY